MKHSLPLSIVMAVIFASCGDAKSSPEEEKQINSMDSVSRAVEDSTDRLKEQTRKVEESLEKLNQEFESETSTQKTK